MTGEIGTIYLLHFERPYKHAQHYMGWCENGRLEERLARHRSGNGARLLRAVAQAGIGWMVVKTWRGTRDDERSIKNRHKRAHGRHCPMCRDNYRDGSRIKETP